MRQTVKKSKDWIEWEMSALVENHKKKTANKNKFFNKMNEKCIVILT
jgi:hypothetical protein